MRLGATEQSGENFCAGDVPAALAQAGAARSPNAPTTCSPRFKLDAEARRLRRLAVGRPAQAARDGARADERPELVMLDEPMAGVNPALTQSLLDHIVDLRDEGMTVLFVEHDMHMVRDIADWVVVMAEGRVIAEGPPEAVMADQRVIDAYLGAHHDVGLGARRLEEEDRHRLAEATEDESSSSRARSSRGAMTDELERTEHRDTRARAAHLSAQPRARSLRADDLIAGYLPGVNILNGADLVRHKGELVGIIGPNGAGKSTLLKAIFGLVKVRAGTVTLNGEDITGRTRRQAGRQGVGFVPQTNNVFPSLTIEENLQMGVYQRPRGTRSASSSSPSCSRRSATARAARRVAVRRRAADGGDGPRADDGAVGAAARRAVGRPVPRPQDEVFMQTRQINRAGVTVIMVEQNARRCLQICDRGYVLDQGRNAYTGTGRELANDPKVIELYLGTLAKA